MFDYLAGTARREPRRARWTTAFVSASAHVGIVLLLLIPALYATDALPEPKEAIAFFVTAPSAPPPPPPPAPPPPVASKPSSKKAQVIPQRTAPARPVAAAPVEAPSEIARETGLEGMPSRVTVDAGFEGGIEGGVPGGVAGGIDTTILPPPPPPPPAPPSAPVRVGGEITAPRLLQRVPPEYPVLAAQAQIEGVVILEATVGADGRVDDVNVLRSHSVLDEAAVAAVKQWVYEPLMLNGVAQPFVLTVTVSFSLTR